MLLTFINRILVLLLAAILFFPLSGCIMSSDGYLINQTKDPITITIKPSILLFKQEVPDSAYQRLVRQNTSANDSIFSCLLLPGDSLIYNRGNAVGMSTLININYLKIQRGDKDSVVLRSPKEIQKRIARKQSNLGLWRKKLAICVTDIFFVE